MREQPTLAGSRRVIRLLNFIDPFWVGIVGLVLVFVLVVVDLVYRDRAFVADPRYGESALVGRRPMT